MRVRSRILYLVVATGLVAALGRAGMYVLSSGPAVPAADELRPFCHNRPAVPVVFTSRTEPASFTAAAPDADGYAYPGTIPWAAREGRLRLLATDGQVFELTWGRPAPGGGTLVDVMSPSVSLDGKRVLFAGRKAPPDPGRWRIYQIDLNGGELTQLTGRPDDAGCVATPPLRFGADGGRMPDGDRRRLDYDDVDPTDLGPNGFAFASSRLPDLGRGHARRATQIWVWPVGATTPGPVSANRYNDRWPYLTASDLIVYSHWSRNQEAVTEDLTDVRPVSDGGRFATAPVDRWMAARVMPNGAQAGYAVKDRGPVWRPRPLFNGRVAFMTSAPGGDGRLRLTQADWGHIRSAPSSAAAGDDLPDHGGARLSFGPDRDAEGRELSAGCPSPCPGGMVLFSAAPGGGGAGNFGLYSVPDDWTASPPTPQLVFDDPSFTDSEPVAVFPRVLAQEPAQHDPPQATGRSRPTILELVRDRAYAGPAGFHENLAVRDAIRAPIPWQRDEPGRRVDPRKDPLVPPPKTIRAVAFYAAHRDRFDDPDRPRVPGAFEKLMVAPVGEQGHLTAWVPSDPFAPTVVAGLDAAGKVATWTGPGSGRDGHSRRYFAYAGDHYSETRTNGYHYCNGCHTGHTFTTADVRERTK